MGTGRERLQALDASVNQLGQASMIAAKDAQAAKTAVDAQGEELRTEIAEVRAIAEKAPERDRRDPRRGRARALRDRSA